MLSSIKSRGLAALSLLFAFVHHGAAADGTLHAGAVAVDISPANFPRIIAGGFLEGKGSQNTDALHARCLVLDDGKTKIAFAVVDTCMMTRQLIDEAKALASRQCGIPTDHIMVSATHTHSAPAAMGCLGTRLDKDYAAFLTPKIAEGIATAAKSLQPARVGWASVDDWEHTHNRRWIRQPEKKVVDPFGNATGLANMHPGYLSADIIGPSGPVDPGLSVLSVQTRDGKPLAVLANYSQHYFGASPVSADYYGLFCRHVAQLLGQSGEGNGPFVCAMSQGTSGDLMWMDYGAPKKTFTADAYAEVVAKYAERALKQIQYRDDAPLAMVEKKLTLNYRVPDENRLAWARPIAAKIVNDVPKDKQEVYAREALILHERQKTEIVLQAIRIGDLTISTLPNEVYALTGLKLKGQSPGAMHFNIELANGGEGYIPTPEQHVLGGYTTWPARTAGLEVQAEPKEVETLLIALEEATGKKRRKMEDEVGSYAKAVQESKPAAYWRLNDAAGKTARNAVTGGAPARISDGAAWYLPGVGSGTGCGTGERLVPSAFSGPTQINRALHLAGGDVQAEVHGLSDHYSIALWFWLGEASGASERNGTLVTGPGGESLVSRQGSDHRVHLMLGDAKSKAELRADDWHFAVLVRDGEQVRVYLDGSEQPELTTKFSAKTNGGHLRFGENLQGKLDELAVFQRGLPPGEIGAFWKVSGIAEQRAKETAARELAEKEATERQRSPKFAAEYEGAVATLKPVVHLPLRAPAPEFTGQRLAVPQGVKNSSAFSVSFWFRSNLANNARPVSAYLFSRGPDGDREAPGEHLGIGGNYRPAYAGRLLLYNGNARGQAQLGSSVIAPGTWNHVVFVRDGARVTAFLNGRQEFVGEAEIVAPDARNLFLGARSDHFAPLEGNLVEFALFDRALAADEAKKLHAASGQPVGVAIAAPLPPPKFTSEPISPADSLRKIHVPPGFKVELVASEPMLLDPVAFDWDERGRLWVVEMADYPLGLDNNGKPGGRVRVIEDTDGDGRYDKSTLFADGLNFPNGLLTWRDGVIVTAAPNILFLRDTNGDGHADEQTVLVSGLQEGNQQLRANGLRWGLDNWVYVAAGGHHGKYGVDTKLKSVRTGEEVLVGSRDFRFRPDTGALEPQSGPTQFGRNRDNWGHWFGSQNSNPLWEYVLPDQYLRRNPHVGVAETRVQLLTPANPPVFPASPLEKRYHSFDQSGHYTSGCSGMVLRDTQLFPANEIHGFACEPFHNLAQHARLTDSGVSFTANRATGEGACDFFASEDRWCRPVMVREGPDGALWVADMYRYMIEHPQFLPAVGKDELLPHYRAGDDRGRIYRVSREGAVAFRAVRFDRMNTEEVVAALDTTNGWQRDKAQQVLLWRADKAAVAPLHALAEKSVNPLARLHALCTLDGLGELTPEEVARALSDPIPGVRENALRLAETRFTPEVRAAAGHLVGDVDAKVRLQLAFSLGASSDPQAGVALERLLKANANEPMIVAAVMSSATPHLHALAKVGEPMEPLLNTALGLNDREALAELLGSGFTPTSLTRLLDLLAQHGSSLDKLRGSHDDALARALARADAIFAQARTTAGDASASPAARIAAAALLSRNSAGRAKAMNALASWLEPQHPSDTQTAALRALGETAADDVPTILAKAWPSLGPTSRQAALSAWMSREAWALDLAQRIERGELAASSVDTVQRSRLLKHDSPRVRQLATKLFSTGASGARSKIVDDYRPVLGLKGEAAKGRDVYLRNCSICHKRGSDGKDIGPDLASVVEHPPEKLLAAILDPNADIQPGFNGYTCTLKSGEQIYGLVSSETANGVTMKLPDASLKTVLRAQISSLQSQNLSLMPEGLEAAITKEDMANLIEFLRTPFTSGSK